jgi:hypothetical protein
MRPVPRRSGLAENARARRAGSYRLDVGARTADYDADERSVDPRRLGGVRCPNSAELSRFQSDVVLDDE